MGKSETMDLKREKRRRKEGKCERGREGRLRRSWVGIDSVR